MPILFLKFTSNLRSSLNPTLSKCSLFSLFSCKTGRFGTKWYALVPSSTNDHAVNSCRLHFLCHLHGFIWTYGAIFTLKTHSSIISTCKNNIAFLLYSQHFFSLKSGATKKSTCALPSFLIQKPTQKIFFLILMMFSWNATIISHKLLP